jgi:hypothetical protein
LNNYSGNKLVLLGDWKPEEIAKWNELLSSEGVYEYDFKWLGRHQTPLIFYSDTGKKSFDAWVIEQSGFPGSRWVAFDSSNNVIASGISVPDVKILTSAIEKAGVISAPKQLRAFLSEHPEHIDARVDLLKEARRRALLATPGCGYGFASVPSCGYGFASVPKDLSEDLDIETDLRIWGVLAREFDLAMSHNSWLGFGLDFFRPEESQPEQSSPLMKAVFRKHIYRVENLLREFPTNENLWDIWAWMARTLNDRPVIKFLQTLEPFVTPGGPQCPSPKVAVWLTTVAKSMEQWDAVVQLARIGRRFDSHTFVHSANWNPAEGFIYWISYSPIPGYPEKSSYFPLLEALLKLGRIDEANESFNELIRRKEYIFAENTDALASEAVKGAIDIIRSNGYEHLLETWLNSLSQKPAPYVRLEQYGSGRISFACHETNRGNEFSQLSRVIDELYLPDVPILGVNHSPAKNTLGWRGDGFRWAMIDENGLVMEQGTEMPTVEQLRQVLEDNDIKIKSIGELAKEFLKENPNHIEALMAYGANSVMENLKQKNTEKIPGAGQDEAIWGKPAAAWAKIFDHEHAIFAAFVFYHKEIKLSSPAMKSVSKRYLPKIEAALRQSPGSRNLWELWLFWRRAGDDERDFESLLYSVEPSPAALKSDFPPAFVLESYYGECRKNERWPQIAKLLRGLWDRGVSEQLIENKANESKNQKHRLRRADMGDKVALPLIDALLHTGRGQEADEVFNAWLDCGGRFTDISKILELAKACGQERLAGSWEIKNRK